MSKSFFVDLTKCTACRGCQVACKQWKKLPAEETKQRGTHQNPADFSFTTYKLVRFNEVVDDGPLKWLFTPDQCRHCTEPPCKMVADQFDERAVLVDETTGAVIYTEYTKAIPEDTLPDEMCPYNVPRRDPESGVWGKCDMCIDRVHNGLKPACVLSCPTGAMNFGDRDEMLAMASARLEKVKKTNPQAQLCDEESVRVIFLTAYPPKQYNDHLLAQAPTFGPLNRRSLLARFIKPSTSGLLG
ncbi:MAG: formate dehydrogenase [Deltaproteobacteria bacterium]|nr:formate dehydrogenase [Deltaproteobacteria bacterium]